MIKKKLLSLTVLKNRGEKRRSKNKHKNITQNETEIIKKMTYVKGDKVV